MNKTINIYANNDGNVEYKQIDGKDYLVFKYFELEDTEINRIKLKVINDIREITVSTDGNPDLEFLNKYNG